MSFRWVILTCLLLFPGIAIAQYNPQVNSIQLNGWATTSRPTSPTVGQTGYNTTLGDLDLWNGSAWTQPLLLPSSGATAGTIPIYGSGTALGAGLPTSGTGSVALTNGPTFVAPNLGTPSAVNLTNATGLPMTTGVTGILSVGNGGTGAASAGATAANNIGALSESNNLSDLASAATARTNLGLGTAATVNTGTSGGVIGLLNGNNTYSGTDQFTGSIGGSALSAYLASPPAIGGAAPGAGTFTTLGVMGAASLGSADVSASGAGYQIGGISLLSSYTGPCDLLSSGCVAGGSLVMRLTGSYVGPLFEVYQADTGASIPISTVPGTPYVSMSAYHAAVDNHDAYLEEIYDQYNPASDLLPVSSITACTSAAPSNCTMPRLDYDGAGWPIAIALRGDGMANSGGMLASGNLPASIPVGAASRAMWVVTNNGNWSECCEFFGYSSPVTAPEGDLDGTTVVTMQASPNLPTQAISGWNFESYRYNYGAYPPGYSKLVEFLSYDQTTDREYDGVQVGSCVAASATCNLIPTFNGPPIKQAAAFTASIAGASMTVTAVSSGILATGDYVSFPGALRGTVITSGSGMTGTYTITPSQTAPSQSMVAGATFVPNTGGGAPVQFRFGSGTDLYPYGGRMQTYMLAAAVPTVAQNAQVVASLQLPALPAQPGACAAVASPVSAGVPNTVTGPLYPNSYFGTPSLDIAHLVGIAGLAVLNPSYHGPLVQVQRQDNGQLYDIYGTGCGLDVTALTADCAGTTCGVRTLYDQTANGWDYRQNYQARQPIITLTGLGGKPGISFTAIPASSVTANVTISSGVSTLSVTAATGDPIKVGSTIIFSTSPSTGQWVNPYVIVTAFGTGTGGTGTYTIQNPAAGTVTGGTANVWDAPFLGMDPGVWLQVNPNPNGQYGLYEDMTMAVVAEMGGTITNTGKMLALGPNALWLANYNNSLKPAFGQNNFGAVIEATTAPLVNQPFFTAIETDNCAGNCTTNNMNLTLETGLSGSLVSTTQAITPTQSGQLAHGTTGYCIGSVCGGDSGFTGQIGMVAVWNAQEDTADVPALYTRAMQEWGAQ